VKISKTFEKLNLQIDSWAFTPGKQRELRPSVAIKLEWPKSAEIADDYVKTWLEYARAILATHRLSNDTVRVVAGHVSRRDGTLRLTDEAIASRSKRSIGSVKRDLSRCRTLGLLVAETVWSSEKKRRERCLRLFLPLDLDDRLNVSHAEAGGGSSQRIPHTLRRLMEGDCRNEA
jgi:hypothetical protein